MMRNISSIPRQLRLEPGEGSPLFLLSLSLFLVIGSTAVIGRTVSRALFLSGLPPQYIPARFLAVTVGVVLTSLLYSRIVGRVRTPHLIQCTTLVMIGGLFIFRLLLNTTAANNLWLLGTFYVFLEIVMALNIVQFWTFASEIVNTRRAKRLFPIVTGAGNLGSMLAGAAIAALVPWLGTLNLIYVIAFMLAVNILLVRTLGRANQEQYEQSIPPGAVTRKTKSERPGPLDFLRHSPLLTIMAIIVVLITLAVNIVDYQFDLSLKSSFASNPQQLSAFLGAFYFWTGIAGLVLQIFFSGPLMRRFGIAAALVIMPFSILTGSILILASGAAQWALAITRSSDTIFRYTVHDTSFNLLYVPVPQQVRSQARAVIDGIFKPLTIGLSGVFFFLAGRFAGIAIVPWSYATILVILLVGIILLRLRTVYLKALHDSIHRRYFDPVGEPLDLSNLATVETIKESLREPNEAEVLHALVLADEITNVDWTPALLPLLEHNAPLVRRQALRMLRRTRSPEYADIVKLRFADPVVDVQASALFTYWALRGAQALAEMQPFMQNPEPKVKAAAVSGALCYGGEAARQVARPVLVSMVADRQQAVRIAAAYALAEMPSGAGVNFLSILLEDSEPQVRRQAVQSAGKLADPAHLPAVIAQLGDPIVGTVAEEALVRYGAQIFSYLETIYAEPAQSVAIRRHIPCVAARIPSPQAVRFLMKNLDEPDDLARSRLYIALGRLRQAGEPLTDIDLAAINRRFEAETRLAYQWVLRASQPQPDANGDLLNDAYSWRRRYAVDRLLYLIAILYPQANIAQVRANLFGGDQRRRANAIELLDTLLSRPHKELFLPLLESSPVRIIEIAGRVYRLKLPMVESEFTTAIAGNDPWLAACTLFSLSRRQVIEFADLIQQGLSSPDALVRETAQLAARRAFEPETYQIAPAPYQNPNLNQPRQAQQEWQWPAWEQEGGIVMLITTMERILLLRRVELFKEIPAQELEVIARLCSVVHFAPGERFISQGDGSDGLYILVSGQVEVSTNDLGVISVGKAGDVIGEMGVLANQLRAASCTAMVETTALHIHQTDLWDLLERNATLSASVIRVLVPKLLSYSEKRYSIKNGLDYKQVRNMPYSYKGDFMGNSPAR
jgi:HEAT repeat protein